MTADLVSDLRKIALSSNPYKTAATLALCSQLKMGELRGVYWRVLLGILPAPQSKKEDFCLEWEDIVDEQRKEFSRRKKLSETVARQLEQEQTAKAKPKSRFGDSDSDDDMSTVATVVTLDNPLSTESTSSYARQFELKKSESIIEKDLSRLWSDDPFFEDDQVRTNIKTILMEYCKDEPLGYRQGMHEIASLVYYVLARDAEAVEAVGAGVTGDEIEVLRSICSVAAVTQDTFAVFSKIMCGQGMNLRAWYGGTVASPTSPAGKGDLGMKALTGVAGSESVDNEVVEVAHQVQRVMLQKADEVLWKKLNKELDIHATSYLLRWLRLLFVREFSFSQCAVVWDSIFAEFAWITGNVEGKKQTQQYDIASSLIPQLAVAMLLYVGSDLKEMDYSHALRRLMRFPPMEDARPIVLKAIERKYPNGPLLTAANALSPSRPASATPTPTAAPVAQAAAPSFTAKIAEQQQQSFLPAPSKVTAQVANVPTTTAAGVASPTRPAFNAPPPLHAQREDFSSSSSLRDKQIRQGMALTSVIGKLEGKWFPEPGQDPKRLEEEYFVAIAELKRIRDVLLNSVVE